MKKQKYEGNAVVYCEGAFKTTNGKTAHGLVRRSHRYQIIAIIDSTCAGQSAGKLLGHSNIEIPIVASLAQAIALSAQHNVKLSHFVVGLAPDGGRLPTEGKKAVFEALQNKLHVVSGLHDFLSEDAELTAIAQTNGATIKDIRKPPHRSELHFFSGKIEEVSAYRLAILGTDSAIGKRTTAWLLHDALIQKDVSCQLIGTGQTAWLQGARYSIVLDSLVNDFVSGEIEHAVWSAWTHEHPKVILLEGQGSLLNPAYPGGFELIAAGRPHGIVLQVSLSRKEYDGFPGYRMHTLHEQIEALTVVSRKPIVAITLNHEGLNPQEVPIIAKTVEMETGIPTVAPLLQGVDKIVDLVRASIAH